jgi:Leucine-rich repeat (LRR) protein
VGNINPLSGLNNLKILSANHTLIVDLEPLKNLTQLEKVYCDQTAINKVIAEKFMATNPKVLVIYNSGDMNVWWASLAPAWQDVLSKAAKINASPSKEELATLTNLDSINVSGNGRISNLEALRPLQKIRVIYANNTSITDLAPLRDHTEIVYLNINETDVTDLAVTRKFTKLKELHADKSKIESIEPLNKLTSLKKLYVDQTAIHDITAEEFLEQNPNCLLVFKTIHLNRWWRGLSSDWKKVIRSQMGTDTTATRENLHKLVELASFKVDQAPITDFAGLTEFVRLKEFSFSGTSMVEIPKIENLRSLKSLHATNSPLMMIDALTQWGDLEELDISNTPIDDLRIIGLLKNLKSFNCAGTQVKRLNALELLGKLQFLDCSNTGVGKLDPLYRHTLKTLKCYNTKVTAREIENFKVSNPQCEVVYYR